MSVHSFFKQTLVLHCIRLKVCNTILQFESMFTIEVEHEENTELKIAKLDSRGKHIGQEEK